MTAWTIRDANAAGLAERDRWSGNVLPDRPAGLESSSHFAGNTSTLRPCCVVVSKFMLYRSLYRCTYGQGRLRQPFGVPCRYCSSVPSWRGQPPPDIEDQAAGARKRV